MKIVVTGLSGGIGRTAAGILAGAGHEVVGLSRSAPLEIPRGVQHLAVDVRDRPSLAAALTGADAVLHCAFLLDSREGNEAMEAVNIGGTQAVVDEAARAGAKRVVFVSSSTVYGPRSNPSQAPSVEIPDPTPHPEHPYAMQKLKCEAILTASPLETLSVRAPIILGRGIDNRLQEAMAARRHVMATGPSYEWQLMHHDDVARFLALAVLPGQPTGIINVAGDGTIDTAELARILGRKPARVPRELLYRVAKIAGGIIGISPGEVGTSLRMPIIDNTRMRTVFGFEPAWNAREIAEDTILAVQGVVTRRGRVKQIGGHVPYRHQILPDDAAPDDGVPLASADTGIRGEFDSDIDPRFPVYSQTNLSEALPGPSTPLTIDVLGRCLRATTSVVADLLELPAVLHTEASARLQGVFAHTVYINASGTYQVANVMPGTDPDSLIDQFAGRRADELPGGRAAVAGSFTPPQPGPLARASAAASVARNVFASYRQTPTVVAHTETQVARLEELAADLEGLSEHRLDALLLLGRDILTDAWTKQGVINMVGGAALTMATKGDSSQSVGQGDRLASGAALRGVKQLATVVAASPALQEAATDLGPGLADRMAAADPSFMTRVRAGLEEYGHRGPGESEFDAKTFSDDVDAFLRTVVRAATSGKNHDAEHGGEGKVGRLARVAQRMLEQRERNRDRCVRATWVYRRIVLEKGRRLAAAGTLDTPGDVFYLTYNALLAPPQGTREVVARRRQERDHFRSLHLPAVFDTTWSAGDAGDRMRVGEVLDGIGICAGTTKGRVRIVDHDSVDDFEDDEILVAHVTDVGYTPLFALAGAVVTDIGGVMSHAAVVAREYGVPCIVDTQVAAARLRNGDLVEVDGKAGTITLIESSEVTA